MNFDPELLRLTAQIASTLVALAALGISLRAERRNQARFERQLDNAERIARANLRPLLALAFEGYGDRKGVILHNHGPGTAVITELWCVMGERRTKDLGELLGLGAGIPFEELTDFPEGKYYVPGKSSEVIARLTLKALEDAGKARDEALGLLAALEERIDDLEMIVTYEDVLGNVIETNARLG